MSELQTFLEKHHYKIERSLSAGSNNAFGEVYLITGELGLQYALKKIKSDDFQKGDYQIASELKHGFIMQTLAMEEIEPFVFIVSEYVENGSLADYIKKLIKTHQNVNVEIATAIITQILTAVDFLQRGNSKVIIHRDLKTANILLLGTPRTGVEGGGVTIKLCDFGCARDLSFGNLARTACVGTPLYTAPEISLVEEASVQYDEKVDNWSVGIILYEMITLRIPFSQASVPAFYNDLAKPIARPPQMDGHEWDELWEVLSGLTKKDPVERLSCADALKILRNESRAKSLEMQKNELEWTVAEEKAEKEKALKELEEMRLKMAELQKQANKGQSLPGPVAGAGASAGGSAGSNKCPPPLPSSAKPSLKSTQKKSFILRDTNMARPENVAAWKVLTDCFHEAIDMYTVNNDEAAFTIIDSVREKETVYVASNRANNGREFLIACRARGAPNDSLMYCGSTEGWEPLDWVRIRTAPDSLLKFIQNKILKGK